VVAGSEKLSNVKLAHFLVKKQNGLSERKKGLRDKRTSRNSCPTRREALRKKPLHVITSRTVSVWCTAGTRLPGTSTYRLVLVDLPVPGIVLLGPRVGLA